MPVPQVAVTQQILRFRLLNRSNRVCQVSPGFCIARVPSTVQSHANSFCGLRKRTENFSFESGISSTLLNTVGVSICLLLFHSLGSVCDNSSFFMGIKAIIKS